MEIERKIKLISSDGEKIEISSKAVKKSNLVKGILEDYPDDVEVPLKNIKINILKKIVEYLEHYENEDPKEIERPLPNQNFKECVPDWDYNYTNVNLDMIFELVEAANYMDIKSLFELTSAKVASIIKARNTEEIKKTFNLSDNFSKEEEDLILKENQWCIEDI